MPTGRNVWREEGKLTGPGWGLDELGGGARRRAGADIWRDRRDELVLRGACSWVTDGQRVQLDERRRVRSCRLVSDNYMSWVRCLRLPAAWRQEQGRWQVQGRHPRGKFHICIYLQLTACALHRTPPARPQITPPEHLACRSLHT